MRWIFLFAVLAATPSAGAQTARAIEVIEADVPPLTLHDGPRLVRQLNQPWAAARDAFVPADSGRVAEGAGRLTWLLPYFAVDRYEAVVADGRIREVLLDFSEDGPDFSGYAGRLRERHGPPEGDGFYRAETLNEPFDLAVRPDERALAFRASGSRTLPPGAVLPIQFRIAESANSPEPPPRDTTRVYDEPDEAPEIVGGSDALLRNVELPDDLTGARGEVLVQCIIHLDGRTSGHAVLRSTDPRLDAAAIAAVQKTRFWPGHVDGEPVQTLIAIPVRIRR